jgi:CheY-like chemotaxis protein
MRRRILLIEDEAHIREIAQISLERAGGFEVLTAASGEEGVRLAARERPDAVLVDVMMPGMDGPATVQQLRRDDRTAAIPVVFLTAKIQPPERERLLSLGVAGIVPKPFDPLELPASVAAALGWVGGDEVDARVAVARERYRPTFRSRLATLEEAVRRLAEGSLDDRARAEAVRCAHDLTGALGTFGLDGSDAARRVEELLESRLDEIDPGDFEPPLACLREVLQR